MSNTQLNIGVLDSGQTTQQVCGFAAQEMSTTASLMARNCDSTHGNQEPQPVHPPIISSDSARISNKKTTYGWSIDVEIADGVLDGFDLTMAMWKALRTQFCTVHQ